MKPIPQYLLIISIICFVLPARAQRWDTVGNWGLSFGMYADIGMTIDANNIPYVVGNAVQIIDGDTIGYFASVVKYENGAWQLVGNPYFSPGIVFSPNIAIDRNGVIYVAYQDGYMGRATVMKYNGSNWEAVGNPGFSATEAWYVNLSLDSSGTPYVAYLDSSGAYTCAATVMKYNGTGWGRIGGPVSGNITGRISMVVDKAGTPYVAYSLAGSIGYGQAMKYDGSNWVTVGGTVFSVNTASSASLAINKNDSLYLAYSDWYSDLKIIVKKFDGVNWTYVGNPAFSDDAASAISIAVSENGTPFVAYSDNSIYNEISVKKYDGSNWVYVGSKGQWHDQSNSLMIAVDKNDMPYVAYDDAYQNWSYDRVIKFDWATGMLVMPNKSSWSLSVLPNPGHRFLALNIASPQQEDVSVIITNALGEKVNELMTVTNKQTILQLNVAPGIYFISAASQTNKQSMRIIMQ